MMRLSQLQRLSALMRQVENHTRKLDSVQRRILAIIAQAGDADLTDDVLDALETTLAYAAHTLTVMQSTLATMRDERQASDTGIEMECE